jgi:hypothetical protein
MKSVHVKLFQVSGLKHVWSVQKVSRLVLFLIHDVEPSDTVSSEHVLTFLGTIALAFLSLVLFQIMNRSVCLIAFRMTEKM